MSMTLHNGIIVTAHRAVDREMQSVWKKANELFGPLVSPIIKTELNGYRSFFVATDGSKEGWAEADEADQNRKTLCDMIDTFAYGDGSNLFSYIDFAYGEVYEGNVAYIARANMLAGKKEIPIGVVRRDGNVFCPGCNAQLGGYDDHNEEEPDPWHNVIYCPWCGQKLEWGNSKEQDYHYEILGADGELIDDGYVALDSAIEYAVANGGYTIRQVWLPLDEHGDINHEAEAILSKVMWERPECEKCCYFGNCINPDKRAITGVELCENYKKEEKECEK